MYTTVQLQHEEWFIKPSSIGEDKKFYCMEWTIPKIMYTLLFLFDHPNKISQSIKRQKVNKGYTT